MELGLGFWFYWLGLAIATAVLAGRRNRCGYVWFMLGLLFNVLALLVVFLLPRLERR